jgi:hypothetical protein
MPRPATLSSFCLETSDHLQLREGFYQIALQLFLYSRCSLDCQACYLCAIIYITQCRYRDDGEIRIRNERDGVGDGRAEVAGRCGLGRGEGPEGDRVIKTFPVLDVQLPFIGSRAPSPSRAT